MSATDFFVAIARNESEVPPFPIHDVFCSSDTQRVTQELLSHRRRSILVLCLVDEQSSARKICKKLFPFFALSEKSSTSFTQFRISFGESLESDFIQYKCERWSDIDAVVGEDELYTCASICASTVVPTEDSFEFDQRRLTLVACTEAQYDAESLAAQAECCAVALGCRFSCVSIYVPASSMSSYSMDHLASISREMQVTLRDKVIGRDERVSSQAKLQDARAWSLLINERYHFSPVDHGPYLINLNPKLVVGENSLTWSPTVQSYIVGEGSNSSPVDFIALPPSEIASLEHRGVYSPHCRLRREGSSVWARPEWGVSYINGNLLAEETLLQDNDRLILGKQLAFRFVHVALVSPPTPSSRILDWEMCAKEFRDASKDVIERGEMLQLEQWRDEVAKQNEALERQLKRVQPHSYIIVHNPPASYQGPILFPFDAHDPALSVSIGPEGAFTLPFLQSTGFVERQMGNLVYVCDGATIDLNHASHFVINDITFSVSIEDAAAQWGGEPVGSQSDGDVEDEMARQAKLSYFDLQWAVALLFDFVFPLVSRDRKKDEYHNFRKMICSDAIMKDQHLPLREISEANQTLTNAVRMIGAGLVKEIGDARTESLLSAREDTGEMTETQREFFDCVFNSRTWGPAQLSRLHEEIGAYLLTSSPPNGSECRQPRASHVQLEASGDTRSVDEKIDQLRGMCALAAGPVMSRATCVINTLSLHSNPKTLWDQYLRAAEELTESIGSSDTLNDNVGLQQDVILAFVDFLFATDYCLRTEGISPSSLVAVDSRVDEWIRIARLCAGSF
ncbi:hypothetical protein STCU_05376 [Strigomonas culicis]|uniref:FHA domain-containing protein n=1 Tax=Strigomonas culicis TaxID=28005 RepID=S9VLB4_9TRYP|nr:hypothetical protein STCU_05376 [Strigomonas culicis]|eukprot:EPY27961.1 hypothetical protein STCU_05376 [Strigomonas culicis]